VFLRAAFAAALVLLAFPYGAFAANGWAVVPGAMSQGRQLPAIVTLKDGRVLAIGGQTRANAPLGTVEIYDPAAKAWAGTLAPMITPRTVPAAAVLVDGRVLVTSGEDTTGKAEIYDPVTNTWTAVAQVPAGAAFSQLVTLADGRVLLIGGQHSAAVPVADTFFFSAATLTWSAGPPMATPRALPSATPLSNGKVLVSGGTSGASTTTPSAELFDPISNSWSPAGEMSTGRVFPAIGRLADGRVLSAGGDAGTDPTTRIDIALASADIYDPATNSWHAIAPMSVPRVVAIGGALADGTFLVAAGASSLDPNASVIESSSERYDPVRGTWTSAGAISTPRYGAIGVPVGNGVLVVGGTSNIQVTDALASADFYTANRPPTAVGTAPAVVQGVAASSVAVQVSAAGSSDPDGDVLTYTWTENATTLAVTVDPAKTATIDLPIGAHALTLTVSDGFGGTATTAVNVSVIDATGGLQTQIASLTAQLQQVQQQLAATQQQLTAAQHSDAIAVATTQTYLRIVFKDPSFTVPGTTPGSQLQAIMQAGVTLNNSCLQDLYRALGGTRK
jgi:hypothetical protein